MDVLWHAAGSGLRGPVFAPGALHAASFRRPHRDTEPGEIQLQLRTVTACRSRAPLGHVAASQTPRPRGRSAAIGVGNAGLRRLLTTCSRPLPARRRRPKGCFVSTVGWVTGIFSKLTEDFGGDLAFLLGVSRAYLTAVPPATQYDNHTLLQMFCI